MLSMAVPETGRECPTCSFVVRSAFTHGRPPVPHCDQQLVVAYRPLTGQLVCPAHCKKKEMNEKETDIDESYNPG